MVEHWEKFQKQQQSFRFAESTMPIDAAELERQRRRQGGLCSVKSLFCCLSVLVGRPAIGSKSSKNQRQSHVGVVRSFENDDDSFGFNFDEQISPRVMTRLANAGHGFD